MIECLPTVSVCTASDACVASAADLGDPTVSDNCEVATVTNDAPDLTFEIRMPLRMPFRTPVLKLPRMPWQSAESGMLPQSAMASRNREVLLR